MGNISNSFKVKRETRTVRWVEYRYPNIIRDEPFSREEREVSQT